MEQPPSIYNKIERAVNEIVHPYTGLLHTETHAQHIQDC
jgi:hypothetical protein